MEKIKIAQIGVTHEHASGKFISLQKLPDIYEIAGYVNDLGSTTTPCYVDKLHDCFKKYPELTLEEVFNDPDIKAVTVEVPNNELVPMALKCAEKGIAMHMDKPAGLDLELYKKLLDICKEKNLPFQMGFMFRGNPAFQFCIRAIREKLIGEVFEIETDMNHCYGGEKYQTYIGKFTGGIMFNLGCHLIDFVVSAMGRPENVTPFPGTAPGYPSGIKNNCTAILEYPNAHVVLRACSKDVCNTPGRSMKICGTLGTIRFSPLERFDGREIEINLTLSQDSALYPKGSHTLRFPAQQDRYTAQLSELAAMVRGEMQSRWSFEHDYLVHEVTLAASGYIPWQ